MKKVLIIGGGGREHCLCWKIKKSPHPIKIFSYPGNAGMQEESLCIKLEKEDLVSFAVKEKIDLTIVGPEAYLVEGIVDEFEKNNLKIFGPKKEAAKIEGSKVFAKELMKKYNIPTGDFKVFNNPSSAYSYLEKKGMPLVIKADGLAAGKGVIIAKTLEEGRSAVHSIMEEKIFKEAGSKILIEEFLSGEEFSFLVITDGEEILPLPLAQDYKKIYDKDLGPNTGGMGCYSPVPFVNKEVYDFSLNEIMKKTIHSLKKEGIDYKGVLYGGLVLTKDGPKTLEFNCRFGDPETQVILPRVENDLLEIIDATLDYRLKNIKLKISDEVAICVVIASSGYPSSYKTGYEISGIHQLKDTILFHAGTKKENEKILTAGGRVLNLVALGKDFKEAIEKVYKDIEKINFEGKYFRKDIGKKLIK